MSTAGPVQAALAARGGTWVDLPALLPASLVLELAGEDLRARLFFASAPDGSELCLRADLTIPAALRFIETRPGQPVAWLHEGKVFRAPRADEAVGSEFVQIGLERYGDADAVAADCDVVLAALEACAAGGLAEPVLTLADGDLVRAVLARADLPEPWGGYLRAVAGQTRSLRQRLAEAAGETEAPVLGALEQALTRLSDAEAEATVAEVLSLSRLTLGPGRSAADVMRRLVGKARRAGAEPLAPATVSAIRALLDVAGPARAAVAGVVGAAHGLGAELSDWAQGWAIRLDALAAAAPAAARTATFRAGRQRNFAYYSGLFFDIAATEGAHPAASGGRYDGLIAAISGGAVEAPAVGCVVRTGRLTDMRNGSRP
jgi:ATP phosphoribosyltransferase regulatory subunit